MWVGIRTNIWRFVVFPCIYSGDNSYPFWLVTYLKDFNMCENQKNPKYMMIYGTAHMSHSRASKHLLALE